jgi:tetrahydromethanopterin S-methyltransferase subunit F
MTVSGKYYIYSNRNNSVTAAQIDAAAIDQYKDDIRDYAALIAQDSTGGFASEICEGASPTTALAAGTVAGTTITCPASFSKISQ